MINDCYLHMQLHLSDAIYSANLTVPVATCRKGGKKQDGVKRTRGRNRRAAAKRAARCQNENAKTLERMVREIASRLRTLSTDVREMRRILENARP